MKSVSRAKDAWFEIESAVLSARNSGLIRPEVTLDDVPAPIRLAKHGLALEGEILSGDDELAHGRFVLLHEPGGQDTWQGDTRIVVFVKAVLEPDLAVDPLLLDVGWDWLTESIASRDVEVVALSGTVSRTGSRGFGDLADSEVEGAIELRASWTIAPEDTEGALLAWCDLLATAGGLVPLQDGVRALRARP